MKKWAKNRVLLFVFLLILLPIFHIKEYYFGMSVPKTLIFRFIIPVWIIVEYIFLRQIVLKISPVFLFFTGYVLFQIFASFFSKNLYDTWFSGFERMYGVVDEILIWFLLILLIQNHKVIIEKKLIFWRVLSLVSLIISIFGIYQHIKTPEIRSESTLSNPLYLGFFVQFSILAHLYILDTKIGILKNRTLNIIYVSLTIISLVLAGFYTGSRSFILALIVGFIIYLILSIHQYSKKRIALVLSSFILVTIVSIIYFKSIETLNLRSFNFKGTDVSTNARLTLWKSLFQNYTDVPILGVGKNNIQYFICKHYPVELFNNGFWYDKLHNAFLDKWVEMGVVGFLIYFAFWVMIIYHVIFKSKKDKIKPLLAAVLISYFVFLNTTFEFLYSQIVFVGVLASIIVNSKTRDFVIDFGMLKKFSLIIPLVIVIFVDYKSYSSYKEWNNTLKTTDLGQFLNGYDSAIENAIFEKKEIAIEMALQRSRVQNFEKEKKIYLSRCENILNKALKTHRDDPVLLTHLGFVLFESNKKNEAILQYENLRKLAPNRIVNLLDLVIFKSNNGEFDSANQILNHIKDLNQSDFTSDYYRAFNYSLMAKKDSTFMILKSIPDDFKLSKPELLETIFFNLKIENEYINYLKSIDLKYFKPKNYQSWLKKAIQEKNIGEIKISLFAFRKHFIPDENDGLRLQFESLILTGRADYTYMPEYFKKYWYD